MRWASFWEVVRTSSAGSFQVRETNLRSGWLAAARRATFSIRCAIASRSTALIYPCEMKGP